MSNVANRITTILGAISDERTEKGLEGFFFVYNNKKDIGKIYLPIHISLKKLSDINLQFKWYADIRETKIVIYV